MSPVTVEIHGLDELRAHLDRMEAALRAAPRQIVTEGAAAVVREMRDTAPHRSGHLAGGLSARVTAVAEQAEARFESEADYTPFVVHGTAAHVIRPAGSKALYWPGAGHPVAFVQHPGTRADDFPGRALDRVDAEINEILDRVGGAVVEGRIR